MADDAPADAGTDETVHPDPAHPENGAPTGAGAAPEHGDARLVDAVPTANGGPVDLTPADAGAVTVQAPTGSAPPEPVALGSSAPDRAAATSDGASTGSDGAPAASAVSPPPNGAGAAAADGTEAAAGNGTETKADTGAAAGDTGASATGATRSDRERGSFWRELPVLVIIAVALAVLIRTFLVQAFFIPSGSMERTLHGCPGCSGDRVLVNKLVYDFRDPKPGEVVVFRGPPSWDAEVPVTEPTNLLGRALRWIGQTVGVSQPDEKDFVKRVIAVGGQTVACCDPKGRVTVDGVPLDEPYVYRSNPDSQPERFGPVTVPEGRLWMMGDHRDGSADSRAHIADGNQGTVPVSNVIGKAFVIVWPPSRWDTLGTPSTFDGLSLGPLGVGAPLGLGLVGALPVAGLRRRLRRRRARRV